MEENLWYESEGLRLIKELLIREKCNCKNWIYGKINFIIVREIRVDILFIE